VAWTLASVHHWPDLEGGLAEVHRVLAPGGRFLAMERCTVPGAQGLASHGWTDHQAELFASMLGDAGFSDVDHTIRRAGPYRGHVVQGRRA
jgi:SAM-dependent methyltransferase